MVVNMPLLAMFKSLRGFDPVLDTRQRYAKVEAPLVFPAPSTMFHPAALENVELKARIQALEIRLSEAHNQNSKLELCRTFAEADAARLTLALSTAHDELRNADIKISELAAKGESYERKTSELLSAHTVLVDTLAAAHDKIAALTHERSVLASANESMEGSLDTTKTEVASLVQEKEELAASLKSKEAEVAQLKIKQDVSSLALAAQKASSVERIEQLTSKLDEADVALQSTRAQLQAALSDAIKGQLASNQLRSDNARLEKKAEALEVDVQRGNVKIAQGDVRISTLEGQLQDASTARDSAQASVTFTRSVLKHCQATLEDTVNAFKKDKQTAAVAINTLQDENAALQASLSTRAANEKALQDEGAALRAELAFSKQQHTATTATLEGTHFRLHAANLYIADLEYIVKAQDERDEIARTQLLVARMESATNSLLLKRGEELTEELEEAESESEQYYITYDPELEYCDASSATDLFVERETHSEACAAYTAAHAQREATSKVLADIETKLSLIGTVIDNSKVDVLSTLRTSSVPYAPFEEDIDTTMVADTSDLLTTPVGKTFPPLLETSAIPTTSWVHLRVSRF